MASIYVAEFSVFGVDPNTGEALAKVPPITEQKVTYPAASSPFNVATRFVRIHNDATGGVSIAFGTGVASATTSNMRLAANQTEYFMVNAGDQVAAVANP